MHESKLHGENSFITLTYENEPAPCAKCRTLVVGSLCVHACQSFLKRLRERIAHLKCDHKGGRCVRTNIRFFLCGEYGEICELCGQGRKVCRCVGRRAFRLGRPHYHAIVFGFSFPDKVRLKRAKEFTLYSSALLSEAWGHGNTSVGEVSFDSAAYVANYATKKVNGAKAKEHYQGRKPEFLIMSRRPGIGAGFAERYLSDVYPHDRVVVRGKETRPPRYYDQKLLEQNPFEWYALKARRALDAEALTELVEGTQVSLPVSRNARRLAVRENVTRAKLALKCRDLEVGQ